MSDDVNPQTSDSLRVLTVRQPWAGSILHHGKDVENRTRNIAGAYRGRVAIHVSKRHDHEAQAGPHHDVLGFIDERHTYGWGAVIGTVNLWAVHQATPGNLCCPKGRGAWGMADHWHLCLTDPKPFAEPIPATGRLGLWRPTPELAEQIRDAERRAHLRPVKETIHV